MSFAKTSPVAPAEDGADQAKRDWVRAELKLTPPAHAASAGPSAGTTPATAPATAAPPPLPKDATKPVPVLGSAAAAPARKAFADAFALNDAKLTAMAARLGGLAGLDPAVPVALKAARDAADLAQAAATSMDFTKAMGLLGPFGIAVTACDQACTTASAAAEVKLGKTTARLTRRVKALKATDLTTEAAAAKASAAAQTQAGATAKSLATPDAVLEAMLKALDDAVIADKAAVDALDGKSNQGAAAGLAEIRKGAAGAIGDMSKGDAKTALQAKLAAWDQRKAACDAEADPAARKKSLKTLETEARQMMTDAMAGQKDAKQEEKIQAVFKKALKARFGLDIDTPMFGMQNTHFDQFYDMMDRVPVQQSNQSSLKKLTYDKKSSGAAYSGAKATIIMGNFGKDEQWDYNDPAAPGTPTPMNAFSINSLHEIGHAVDDRYKIMQKFGADPKCAAWKAETLDTVVAAFVTDLALPAATVPAATLTKLFSNALTSGSSTITAADKKKYFRQTDDSEKPSGLSDSVWKTLKTQLDRAIKTRTDTWPWGRGRETTLGGRAYHESYKGRWVSYDPAARAGTEVRDYQFRAPGEWFAELYAYTWFNQKKPPAGILPDVKRHLYKA